MTKIELTIKGMHCQSCVAVLTDVIQETGAKNVKLELDETKIGKLTCDGDKKKITEAIKKQGYTV